MLFQEGQWSQKDWDCRKERKGIHSNLRRKQQAHWRVHRLQQLYGRENHDWEPADREKKQQTSANVARINDGPRSTFSSGTWLKRTLHLKWILCSCGSRNIFWSFMGDPNTVAQEQFDWAYKEQQWLPQWRVLPIPGEEDLKIIIKNPTL